MRSDRHQGLSRRRGITPPLRLCMTVIPLSDRVLIHGRLERKRDFALAITQTQSVNIVAFQLAHALIEFAHP